LSFLLLTYVTTVPLQHEIILVASLLASSVAALGLSLLLLLEQQRALKPSDLAVLYLVPSIVCDVLLLTMPSGILTIFSASRLVLARCFIHLVLLVLECCNKRHSIGIYSNLQSPEELHSVFGRLLYIWINPILLQGYRNILVIQDLPFLTQDMGPEFTRNAIIDTWSRRG
jgi:ATP-binding cassette, subfamily C (CFTR/MRP), member 1